MEVMRYVREPDIRSHLRDVVLETYLADTKKAMLLTSDGTYQLPTDLGKGKSEATNAQKNSSQPIPHINRSPNLHHQYR